MKTLKALVDNVKNPLAPEKEKKIVPLHEGNFQVGKQYPQRDFTQFVVDNWKGYPSKEAYYEAREKKQKMNVKEEKRKESLKKEARNIQDIAREYSEAAMEVFVEVMTDKNAAPAARLEAAEKVISRGYGKPVATTINQNLNTDVKPSNVDDTTLDLRITEALTRVERLTSREAKEATSSDRPSDLFKYN